MICVHCSTPVPDEAKFCHSCGSLVSDAGGQAAATASMDQNAFAHLENLLREEIKGEFTLGKMLGRGGMAVVYLATETHLSRKVALKVLPPELTFGHGVDRFMREAKTAAALDHPHIIPIYRIGQGGKIFWYAMKFLEGTSLDDVLKDRGPYELDEALDILEQVADALDYAHAHQVIHRDIKPANIMLDQRKNVVITDFGIAKALTEGALTASGSVIGTPYFMSPEQGMGKPVAGAADQYSVAVMAYRMLAGHVPFDGDSAIDILHKHCMAEAPRLDEDMEGIPTHVASAIEKAMAKKAADRFPTVSDFVAAMRDEHHLYARPSVKTVMLSPDEVAKATSGPRKQVTKASAKKAAKTMAARARPVPAAPAPKSRAGLFVALTVLLLGGGGYAGWTVLNRPAADPGSGTVAEAPPTTDASGPAVAPDSTPAVVTPPPVQTQRQDPPPTTRQPDPAPREPRPREQARATTPPANNPTPPPQQPAQPPAAAAPATLRLGVSPPADVTIDGVARGQQRQLITELTAGQHQIRVEREGYVTKDTTVTLTAGQTETIRLTLEQRP
ncbi:MAG: protein kinase [Gemmatimonadaceae bacterium]